MEDPNNTNEEELEEEATSDPWAWATDLDPAEIQKTFENTTAMQRAAHERNAAAKEQLSQAEELMRRAQEMPQQQYQQHPEPTYSTPSWEIDPMADDSEQRLHREMGSLKSELHQIREQQAAGEWNRSFGDAVHSARDALSDNEFRDFGALFGGKEAAQRYVQRAVAEDQIPPQHTARVADRVRELAREDRDRIGALVNERVKGLLQTKARANDESIPAANQGPQSSARSRPPNKGFKKPDWTKPVSDAEELEALMQLGSKFDRDHADD